MGGQPDREPWMSPSVEFVIRIWHKSHIILTFDYLVNQLVVSQRYVLLVRPAASE